ncbi:hypothetical protein [Moraxella lacunata]|uniref:hypothetical protein n=1 Tax=Moraxella lacunata TaxID=477 RepID=UPI000AC26218
MGFLSDLLDFTISIKIAIHSSHDNLLCAFVVFCVIYQILAILCYTTPSFFILT